MRGRELLTTAGECGNLASEGSRGHETSPNYGAMGSLHCPGASWCRVHRHDVRDVRCSVLTSGCRRRLSFLCDCNIGRHSDTNARAHTCSDSRTNSQTGDSGAGRRHAGTSPTSREHLWRPE
jgi:hypothetical protein